MNDTTSPVTAIFSFLFSLGAFQRNVSVTVESGGIEERSEEKEFLRVYTLFQFSDLSLVSDALIRR